MISPDLLWAGESETCHRHVLDTAAYRQIGICIGLSFVSTYSPRSFSACTTATRAWKRFMPCSNK